MISGKVTDYFKSVPTVVYLSMENRKAAIEIADESVEAAVEQHASDIRIERVSHLRKAEPLIILESDEESDDDVIEISKEEAEEAERRSYKKRPSNWIEIAQFAIETNPVY